MKVACPQCGADVVFRSPALPVRVCEYCRTSVMRIDEGVRDMGRAAVLPFDVSPVQIGTTGFYGSEPFEVVGRVRWGWTAGSWNEWLLLTWDGSKLWLGDAMGEFMILGEHVIETFDDPTILALARGEDVPVGSTARVYDETLIVSDSRQARCIAAEGELPFVAPPGWTVHSVDFRGPSGAAATFQRDGDEASFYHGRYVTLAELSPRNLRPIEGWPLPAFAA